ncbi:MULTISPECIES: hypothetical protein [Actinomadura]|uniref:DUF2613 family protein n=1 Tax=Actinomadura sediminis TaxID=1038904 RepID=A0ABW3EPT9_9ACTN|nr:MULTISPECIES: hypothetical protein [Actinomadura]GGV09243.1 hypothetical protein GCM10010182_30910 [Actinomadura cremea]
MRIAIAIVVGALLAAGTSLGAVQLASASQEDPVIKPLYNYGER